MAVHSGINSEPDIDTEESVRPSLPPGGVLRRAEPLVHLLWAQRRFLAKATLLALLISTAVAFLWPPTYESSTRLMPPDTESRSGMALVLSALTGRGGGAGGAATGLAGAASDLLGLKNSTALFVGVLNSRTVQYRLIDRFDLRKVYRKRYMQDAAKKLAENTVISEDRKSGILTITVADKNRERAAAMARAYVEELDRAVAQLSTSAARRERLFLEQRLKDVQADLEVAERDLSKFSAKNATIDIKEQGKAMLDAAAKVQGNLIAAQSELQGLKQIYTDNNVRVRAVEARISELQRQLNNLGGTDPDKKSPGPPRDTAYPSIRELPVLGVTYADLYRRTKVQETVFEILTQQYELAKVQEARETPSVKVLDPANLPEKKAFPPRLVFIIVGTLLGLVVISCWILGKDWWRTVDPHDPGKLLVLNAYNSLAQELHALRSRRPQPPSDARN